jgi:hypothetical protein
MSDLCRAISVCPTLCPTRPDQGGVSRYVVVATRSPRHGGGLVVATRVRATQVDGVWLGVKPLSRERPLPEDFDAGHPLPAPVGLRLRSGGRALAYRPCPRCDCDAHSCVCPTRSRLSRTDRRAARRRPIPGTDLQTVVAPAQTITGVAQASEQRTCDPASSSIKDAEKHSSPGRLPTGSPIRASLIQHGQRGLTGLAPVDLHAVQLRRGAGWLGVPW